MNISIGTFIAIACQGEVGEGTPTNTVAPSITSADYNIGTTITVSLGTWTGATSLAGSLRHVSDDTEIDTFTADGTYLLADTDFGEELYIHVTAQPGGVEAAGAAVGPVAVVYLWRDDYSSAVAAPLAGTRTNTPGPGSTTIVDADNELSVHATNKLVFVGTSPAYGDPQIRTSVSHARAVGRAVFIKTELLTAGASRDNGTTSYGWSTTTGFSFDSRHVWVNSSRAGGMNPERSGAVKVLPWARDTDYVLGVILRANGAHYVARGGAYGDWVRAGVTRSATTTPLYAGRQWGPSAGQPDRTKAFYGADLGGAWATDTDYDHLDDTPTANDTATGQADGLQYISWTPVAAETHEISFRRTDDSNRMVLRSSQGGSTMKIIKIEAGVETELSSVAQTFTAATPYRLGLRYIAGEVRSWVKTVAAAAEGDVKNDITGATYNLAATGVKVAGFATGAYWEVWPYYITGGANTQLDMYAPSL
jgi:hypothetical protein